MSEGVGVGYDEPLDPADDEEKVGERTHAELAPTDPELIIDEEYECNEIKEEAYPAEDYDEETTEYEAEADADADADEQHSNADVDASDNGHEEMYHEEEDDYVYDDSADHPPADDNLLSSPAFARVTYEYQRQKEDELDLKEGDIIIVTRKPTAGGWWFGQLGNDQGWFPQDFVTDIDEDQVKIFLQQQKQQHIRKATIPAVEGSSIPSSSPGTPPLSKQAAMAEMAQLQSELRLLEQQRIQLQQTVHYEREQRTKHLRSAKSELSTAMLPLPNAFFVPSSSLDGATSAMITHFTWDAFSRDLLRCCSRLAASVDADAALQEMAGPNLLQSLTGLTMELQAALGSVKDDKDLQRMIDQLRSVSNPLMNLSANIDPAPMHALHELMETLASRVKAASVAPPASAPPPPPMSRPSLPLSPDLIEDAPAPKRKKSASKSPRHKASRKDKDKRKKQSSVPTHDDESALSNDLADT